MSDTRVGMVYLMEYVDRLVCIGDACGRCRVQEGRS